MSLLVLGDIVFEAFEVPSTLKFGGAQKLAVHKMIGGGRVIDALGRDDAAIQWRGVLSGGAAVGRARGLDLMRTGGTPNLLSWSEFSYVVILTKLDFDFTNPWWIPYSISCTVQSDASQAVTDVTQNIALNIVEDLSAASVLLGQTTAILLPTAAAINSIGSPASQADAGKQIGGALAIVSVGIDQVGHQLGQPSLTDTASASGNLAQLVQARGFLARAAINLQFLGA